MSAAPSIPKQKDLSIENLRGIAVTGEAASIRAKGTGISLDVLGQSITGDFGFELAA